MRNLVKICSLVCIAILPVACAIPAGNTPAEQRQSIDDMRDDVLAELYSRRPAARAEIERAPGYAVFSNIATKIFLLGTGNGYGVVVDNSNAERTYMAMNQVDAGPGFGIKSFRAVFVFGDSTTLHDFVDNGWQFGAQAEAAAKVGDAGAAATAEGNFKGIKIYRITKTGVALQATVGGTKYWKKDEWNER